MVKTPTNVVGEIKHFLTKKRYIYKPYLEIYLSVGWVQLQTVLMRQAIERDEFTYLALKWQVLKWSGEIRLYRPGYDYRIKKGNSK